MTVFVKREEAVPWRDVAAEVVEVMAVCRLRTN